MSTEIQFCVICYINNVEFTSVPVPRAEAEKLLTSVQALTGVSTAWMTRADEIDRLMKLKYASQESASVNEIVEDERRGQ